MNTPIQADDINEILYYFKNEKITKQVAINAIIARLKAAEVAARINSLLDLEQWVKLHDLQQDMILDGIEHMVISMLQSPDQRHQDHAKRIATLKAESEEV